MTWGIILPILLVALVVIAMSMAVKIVKQQRVAVVERLGKFRRTLPPGPHLLIPMIDSVRLLLDMR